MRPRWCWAICLLIVAGISLGADERRDMIPKDIKEAEQKLTKWISGFEGQTLMDVRKTLGAPDKETSWIFEEKKELALQYKVGDSTKLSLYFHEGRVVKVALHLIP